MRYLLLIPVLAVLVIAWKYLGWWIALIFLPGFVLMTAFLLLGALTLMSTFKDVKKQ